MIRLLLSITLVAGFAVAGLALSPSQNTTIFLSKKPAPPAPPSSACPRGTSFPDGCSGAVAGTPNNPTLLDTYGANRPPWNVAGVDYRVGHSGALQDPSVAGVLPACATYSSAAGNNAVTVNSSPCTVDHFDLTLYGGICLNVSGGITNGQTVTLTNNSIKAGANCQPIGGGIMNIGSNAHIIIRYNTLDDDYHDGLSNIINIGGTGDKTIEYNVMLHPPQHDVGYQGSGNYIVRFNYALGEGCCTNHGDWFIFNNTGGTTYSLDEQFNTVTIDPDTVGLGFNATAFCYMTTFGNLNFTSGKCANDTYISALSGDGRGHVSYVIRVEPATALGATWGPVTISNNYIDWIGSYGAIFGTAADGAATVTCNGNIDLRTGSRITGTFGGFFTCN